MALVWWQRVEAEQLRHRRRAWTPGAPQAEHHRADRSQRVTVDRPEIDRWLVPQPGQKTSSHGVPASSAARSSAATNGTIGAEVIGSDAEDDVAVGVKSFWT